jgi:uncharacterized protein
VSNLPATIRERSGDGDGRTVEVRIMPWGEVAETPEGRETFERGAFAGTDPTRVTIESQRHGGTLVGRGTTIAESDDAAYLHARISETPAGDELLTLIRDGVVSAASVSFQPTKTARRKGVLVRQAVDLWRVAIVERSIYPGAGVLAVRSNTEDRSVTETVDSTEGIPAPANDADRTLRAAIEPVMARLAGLDDRVIELQTRAAVPSPANRPDSWSTGNLGDLLTRSFEQIHERANPNEPSLFARAIANAYHDLHERALIDQITTDNPGLIPPAHLTEAVGILNAGRPSIEGFGGARSLPETGVEVDWPALVPLAGRAIAKQATEKTEVVSRKISFTRKTAPLATYAGASDISLQLLRRSSPAYRDLFARVMLSEYARVTEDQFTDDVLATVGIQVIDYDPAADTDGKLFRSALFAASVKVQRATGSPASVAIVSEDLFVKMGGWDSMVAPNAGPTNAVGTASARNLDVSISGIQIVLGNVDMAAGAALVSNRSVGGWYEDGPFSMEALDVARLGTNVAYWGLGATVIQVPAGIVHIHNVLP